MIAGEHPALSDSGKGECAGLGLSGYMFAARGDPITDDIKRIVGASPAKPLAYFGRNFGTGLPIMILQNDWRSPVCRTAKIRSGSELKRGALIFQGRFPALACTTPSSRQASRVS